MCRSWEGHTGTYERPFERSSLHGSRLHVACREQHLHTVAGQLVEHDHLVGVDPGEAIRRQAPYGVEEPRLGRVTKSIEGGAIQAGTRGPVIDGLCDPPVAPRIGPPPPRGAPGGPWGPG